MPHIPDAVEATGDLPAFDAGGAQAVPYAVMWNSKRVTYGESSGEKTPTTITAKVQVNWADSSLFTTFARGFAFVNGTTKIGRWLPLKCPWDNDLYCSNIQFSQMGKDTGPDDVDNWPTAEWVEYEVTFSVRPYDLQTDTFITSLGSELGRYVTRKRRYNYKERRINAYQLEFAGGEIVSVPSFVPFAGSEVEYLWHMVPAASVSYDALDAAFGKVNDAAFDTEAQFGERGVGGPFAAETLLFVGFSSPWNTYPMSNGKLAYDIPFLFRHNPLGWNKFPQPSTGAYLSATLRGTATKVYTPTSFADLFKGRAF